MGRGAMRHVTPSTAPAGVASETVSQTISVSSQTSAEGSAQKAQQWEPFDNWELAMDGIVFDAARPPRIVFGPLPSLEEAKEATSDFNEALEEMHFKPSITAGSGRSPLSSESSETKVCVDEQSVALSPMPNQAIQAFSLLQRSTEAQNVVASLVCDKNLWDAVLKNEKVMEFCRTNQALEPVLAGDINMDSQLTSNVENEYVKGASECMGTEFTEKEPETSSFAGFKKNIRLKINKVVSNISNLFQSFMGSPAEESGTPASSSPDGGRSNISNLFQSSMGSPAEEIGSPDSGSLDGGRSKEETAFDMGFGASFVLLAIAVIMVVMFKRVIMFKRV